MRPWEADLPEKDEVATAVRELHGVLDNIACQLSDIRYNTERIGGGGFFSLLAAGFFGALAAILLMGAL